MANLSGLMGTAGGFRGTGVEAPNTSTVSSGQLDQAYQQNQDALAGQRGLLAALQGQNGLQNQSQVYNQQQDIVAGRGPNPAQAQLAQATAANTANQAALMAGQRGSSTNTGLMARQAAMQGANNQQNQIGQAATLQAQQSLNALNNAGGMANTMANNQIGQTNANTQAAQAEQSSLLNATNAQNAMRSGLINQTAAQQASFGGGMANGIGSAMSAGAEGGPVTPGGIEGAPTVTAPPQVDQNNFSEPKSRFGQFLKGSAGNGSAAPQAGTDPLVSGLGNLGKGIGSAISRNSDSGEEDSGGEEESMALGGVLGKFAQFGGKFAGMAEGGKVPALVSPGEQYLSPKDVKKVEQGKDPLSVGERIPGKPKHPGNDYRNDTVKKTLKAGGLVIPNEVMQSKRPHWEAMKFVHAHMAKQGKMPKKPSK